MEESRGLLTNSSSTLRKARPPFMKDRAPGNITRILYGQVKSGIGTGDQGEIQVENESRLYDLVKNEGEDGSDGQRSDSCQEWEGIATL